MEGEQQFVPQFVRLAGPRLSAFNPPLAEDTAIPRQQVKPENLRCQGCTLPKNIVPVQSESYSGDARGKEWVSGGLSPRYTRPGGTHRGEELLKLLLNLELSA